MGVEEIALSINQFGAKGDGSDATAALQDAMLAANSDGCSVLIPIGTFLISSDLTVTAPLVFAKGGILTLADGVMLTINDSIEAGFYQIFSLGAGSKVCGSSQKSTVKPHWWGIIENDPAADNSSSIIESLSSFIDCTVDFGGMKAYMKQVGFAAEANEKAPLKDPANKEVFWKDRSLRIRGNGAVLISTATMSSITGPVFGVAGFTELELDDLAVKTAYPPNIDTDIAVGYTHLIGISGETKPPQPLHFARRIIIRNCNAFDGWQCGISVGLADVAIIEKFKVKNVLGSGIYTQDIKKLAVVREGEVSTTGDDSIAFTTDIWAPDGTEMATVDSVRLKKTNASGITFAGVQHCVVGKGVRITETYGPGIRTQHALSCSSAQQQIVRIDGPRLIRCGRKLAGNPKKQQPASAIGIGVEATVGGIISITGVTILDAKYGGIFIFDDCALLMIAENIINGAKSLTAGEDPTFVGIHVGQSTFSPNKIERAILRGNDIRHTGGYSLFIEKVINVTVEKNYFKAWDLLGKNYPAVAVVNCTTALVDCTNVFDGNGLPIEASGTLTYQGATC